MSERNPLLYYILLYTDTKTSKIYNMINLASVIENIRSGAILTRIKEEYLDILMSKLKQHKIHASVYNKNKETNLYNIIISNNIIKSGNNSNLGRVLGYYNPSIDYGGYKHNIYVKVIIQSDDEELSIHFFPQKIKEIKDDYKKDLEKMAKRLEKMKLVEGYKILNATPVFV
jgi:lauroyl/myristoyl acyltransferase